MPDCAGEIESERASHCSTEATSVMQAEPRSSSLGRIFPTRGTKKAALRLQVVERPRQIADRALDESTEALTPKRPQNVLYPKTSSDPKTSSSTQERPPQA